MFGNPLMSRVEKQLKDRCEQLKERNIELRNENDQLEDACHTQKIEYDKLKRLKKIEEEEVAHKIRCREETVELEKQKGIAKAERDADKKIMLVKGEYQDKLTGQLEKRGDELREMYTEILTRLPAIDVKIGDSTVKQKKQK